MEKEKKVGIVKKVLKKFKYKYDPVQLGKGIDSEKEHDKEKSTNVVKGDKMKLGKIAIAHLKEDPKYYDHLEKMENKYNKK